MQPVHLRLGPRRERGPLAHERTPPGEQVTPEVSPLDTAHHMS